MKVQYTVGTVAELCDLSEHTIRAWERRYGAVSPHRSATNRRLYDDADLYRFKLLKGLVDRGHTIGQIAALQTSELETLTKKEHLALATPKAPVEAGEFIFAARQALARLNAGDFEDVLANAAARVGLLSLIEDIVIPLLREVENGWVDGELSIYEEHFATAVLRTYLDRVRQSLRSPAGSPILITTTPSNQHHEIGAMLVSLVSTLENWNVVYLGPNLPANEISIAAKRVGASAIGLSLVYPTGDPLLPAELRRLRALVGEALPIFVGGGGATRYLEVLLEVNAIVLTTFAEFRSELRRVALEVPTNPQI